MFPGKSELLDNRGLNSNLSMPLLKNTEKNGVLTGIEDFLNGAD